ncbi:MAG: NAD(P)/FAD-dependent oxidoreductase [Candidatus Marinimicrobia bacterium]|nr:NAD(P)/FAD-dependent oxidoreductase [Candidatus Neomarinimicrobiota bacterium]
MNIAVIGGGAAGYFAAITAKETFPRSVVTIFEKSGQVLAKVRISGGGRCNVTNGTPSRTQLIAAYPRGGNALKRLFHRFDNQDAMAWFQQRGVPLVVDPDNRVFPKSRTSRSIVDCFLKEAERLGIDLVLNSGISEIRMTAEGLGLCFSGRKPVSRTFNKVIVATGGSPKPSGLVWLERLGHDIVEPVPSLFTFNLPRDHITRLPGLGMKTARVSIDGTKYHATGPLLITHWGFSGPAILQLSALASRKLAELNYDCTVRVNWINLTNENVVLARFQETIATWGQRQLSRVRPFEMPERLWHFLLERCGLILGTRWRELSRRNLNQLLQVLTADRYTMSGKTTFKEEFVTCGGVSLGSVNTQTLESKVCPNLYFAGEVLDIDGITGGFNFQAAWTTGFVAGQLA